MVTTSFSGPALTALLEDCPVQPVGYNSRDKFYFRNYAGRPMEGSEAEVRSIPFLDRLFGGAYAEWASKHFTAENPGEAFDFHSSVNFLTQACVEKQKEKDDQFLDNIEQQKKSLPCPIKIIGIHICKGKELFHFLDASGREQRASSKDLNPLTFSRYFGGYKWLKLNFPDVVREKNRGDLICVGFSALDAKAWLEGACRSKMATPNKPG